MANDEILERAAKLVEGLTLPEHGAEYGMMDDSQRRRLRQRNDTLVHAANTIRASKLDPDRI